MAMSRTTSPPNNLNHPNPSITQRNSSLFTTKLPATKSVPPVEHPATGAVRPSSLHTTKNGSSTRNRELASSPSSSLFEQLWQQQNRRPVPASPITSNVEPEAEDTPQRSVSTNNSSVDEVQQIIGDLDLDDLNLTASLDERARKKHIDQQKKLKISDDASWLDSHDDEPAAEVEPQVGSLLDDASFEALLSEFEEIDESGDFDPTPVSLKKRVFDKALDWLFEGTSGSPLHPAGGRKEPVKNLFSEPQGAKNESLQPVISEPKGTEVAKHAETSRPQQDSNSVFSEPPISQDEPLFPPKRAESTEDDIEELPAHFSTPTLVRSPSSKQQQTKKIWPDEPPENPSPNSTVAPEIQSPKPRTSRRTVSKPKEEQEFYEFQRSPKVPINLYCANLVRQAL